MTLLLAALLFDDRRLSAIDTTLGRPLGRLRGLLGNRVAHFLADVSYGLYLLHLLILIPVLDVFLESNWYLRQQSVTRFLLLTAIAGPITLALAWILFIAVESPGIRAGKGLIRRFRALRPRQPGRVGAQ